MSQEDQAQAGASGDILEPEKSNASKNALIHGVYASDILLPGESEEHFTELYDALRADLNPASPLEEEAVLDIVRFHWLKRRSIQASRGKFHEGTEPITTVDLLYMWKNGMGRDPLPVKHTYEPPDLERVIKLEAMIDARIEKALARLARIKEYRRIYGGCPARC